MIVFHGHIIDVPMPNDDDIYPMSEQIRLIVDVATGRGNAGRQKGVEQYLDASEVRIPLDL